MNQYIVDLGNEPLNPGQLANQQTMLRHIGELLTGAGSFTLLDVGRFRIQTPWRVNQQGVVYPDGMSLTLVLADRALTAEQYLIDVPYLEAGNTVYAFGDFNPSNELSDEITIQRSVGSSRLVIGTASRSAQDGIYEDPFQGMDSKIYIQETVASVAPPPPSSPGIVGNQPVEAQIQSWAS